MFLRRAYSLLSTGYMTAFTRIYNRFSYLRALLLWQRRARLTNRTPVISFTFDDFPRSALEQGGSILQEYGLAATYYAALGLMNSDSPVGRIFSEEHLHDLLARGHELGCHTFDHYDAWNTLPKRFEDSVLRNRQALGRFLPGASFATL